MTIGPVVRSLFGRHERLVAQAYRSIFIDVDHMGGLVGEWTPNPLQILEVGCGDGAVTEQLVRQYPQANILAIDITPRVGRLFSGNRGRVEFAETTVQAIAAARPGQFDLVVLSDVLHHVPIDLREDVLASIRLALAPGGSLFFKDWERDGSAISWLAYASDRWITGDRIRFFRGQEALNLIRKIFGPNSIVAEARLRPWNNNFALLVRP